MPDSDHSAPAIRDSFLNFFKEKGHQFVRSAPVVSHDDPTLLFTNAGMNQFKPIFLGENKDKLKRAVNSQKCIRVSGKHNDLEEVGKDTYHHTFFEMLGNWSFGDYYKKEAIQWAWELLTTVWKLPADRLFATVYQGDDETFELWSRVTDIDPTHILRFGEKDNFWEMGEVGPCGPCSEIHYDTGDEKTRGTTFKDADLGVNGSHHRYIEIWNLVFIQFQRLKDRSLQPLAAKHVDTGMGFERICSIIQGVGSNYETDLFKPIITEVASLTKTPYSTDETGTPHRVIADHLRTLVFAIADGAVPSNEGRGYVLRRILRRASRYARSLGQNKPFLCRLVPVLVQEMGNTYPELAERESFVTKVIQTEEESFIRTLDQGLARFEKISDQLVRESRTAFPGKEAFTLYDTYGFPPDLTSILAGEKGLTVDMEAYQQCMEEQNQRARGAAKFGNELASDEGWTIISPETKSEFIGYDNLSGDGKVLRHRVDGLNLYIVLDRTPFYAEAGGQVGDTGILSIGGTIVKVTDTVKLMEMILHICEIPNPPPDSSGYSQPVRAEVNAEYRAGTFRNHSATHLLQSALQKILGNHVQQQGSRVSADSLRFDFTHPQGLTSDEIQKVEDLVNTAIREDLPVEAAIHDYEAAKKRGAMALFGEKYGDQVRVIQMGDVSLELCGGTHAQSTGQIGLFKITSEGSIASGVRRIEALTGEGALNYLRGKEKNLSDIGQTLKAKPGTELAKVQELLERTKQQEKEFELLKRPQSNLKPYQLIKKKKKVAEVPCLITSLGGLPKSEVSFLVESLGDQLKEGAALLTNVSEGGLSIIALVGPATIPKIKANLLVQEVSKVAGGKGGGRPDRAQAGSKNPEKEGEVLKSAEKVLTSYLTPV